MTILPSANPRARVLFDVVPANRLGAAEQVLTAETGQAATFARSTRLATTDQNGAALLIAPYQPAFAWGTFDFDDDAVSVGQLLDGDTLTYPFSLSVPLTLYLRFARGREQVAGVIAVIGLTTGARLVVSEDPATGYSVLYHNGTSSKTSSVAMPLLHGERTELRIVLGTTLTLFVSVNGCTETSGTPSAAFTMATAWSANTLSLCAHANGTLPTTHTLVRCAIALGSVAITSFRPGGRDSYSGSLFGSMAITLTSAGVYGLSAGTAALELVDIGTTGVYTLVAAGTSISDPRVVFRRIAGRNVVGA